MAKRVPRPRDGIEREKSRQHSRATKRGIERAKRDRLHDLKAYSRSKDKSGREIVAGLFGSASQRPVERTSPRSPVSPLAPPLAPPLASRPVSPAASSPCAERAEAACETEPG